MTADQFAHALDPAGVGDDGADADDVVAMIRQIADEPVLGRKVEKRAWGLDVGLEHQQ